MRVENAPYFGIAVFCLVTTTTKAEQKKKQVMLPK